MKTLDRKNALGDSRVTPEHYRTTISKFATGVSVLSSVADSGHCVAATINSLTSVSLSPPTLLFLIRPGKLQTAIDSRGYLGASILRSESDTISAHFAGSPQAGLCPEFVVRRDCPTLKNALAWFECKVVDTLPINDHRLYLGEIVACGSEDKANEADECSPLVFFCSSYRKLAPHVVV